MTTGGDAGGASSGGDAEVPDEVVQAAQVEAEVAEDRRVTKPGWLNRFAWDTLWKTRMELRSLSLSVEGKVSVDDVDPSLVALNDGIETARVKLAAAEDAAEENWAAVNDELSGALDSLRDELAETAD